MLECSPDYVLLRSKVAMITLSEIRWRCRRGMLELDLMLIAYLEQVYPFIASAKQNDFLHLLEENDQYLFDLLTNKIKHPDPSLADTVQNIRMHSQTHE